MQKREKFNGISTEGKPIIVFPVHDFSKADEQQPKINIRVVDVYSTTNGDPTLTIFHEPKDVEHPDR